MAGAYVVVSDFHHSELSKDDPEWKSVWEITKATPRIFISNWHNACDEKKLKELGIKAILCIGERNKCDMYLSWYKEWGIEHKFISLEDKLGEKLESHFGDIWDWMLLHSDKPQLVHDYSGMSAAPAAVVYFLMRKMHMQKEKPEKPQTEKILRQLELRRSCIRVNIDFLNQIRKYEASIMRIPYEPLKDIIPGLVQPKTH